MQNLEWKDKIDKESDIEAKDVNSLANAIITIIDWINSNGNNGNIDLSDYVKKEYDRGLSTVSNITFPWHYEDTADGTENEYMGIDVEYFDDDDENWHDEMHLYTKDQIDKKLSELPSGGGTDLSNYYTKAEVEAYIEETLLGGAW